MACSQPSGRCCKAEQTPIETFLSSISFDCFFFLPLLSACGFEKAGRNLCERNYSLTFAVIAHLMVRKKRVWAFTEKRLESDVTAVSWNVRGENLICWADDEWAMVEGHYRVWWIHHRRAELSRVWKAAALRIHDRAESGWRAVSNSGKFSLFFVCHLNLNLRRLKKEKKTI